VDENVSVPVDESQPTCALSGEEFETFWNEAEQEWHYRGAIVLDRAVGGAKKGSIVLARAVPKKRVAAKGKAKATATVKTEDAGARRSARGVKTKADDEPLETSPAKRTRTRK
jgi:pre-mRNA cleavage complex 2 protein Pcf11